jgi:ATP-dependent helicase/DNAse subunit B
MFLLTGPPGSGKSHKILEEFREALRLRNAHVRLIVPTATMAEHLRHQLAREEFLVRPASITTLAKFIEPWAGDMPQISSPALYLAIEEILQRLRLPEFALVSGKPGFCASLVRSIEELYSAGCDSERLAACLPDGPLAPAFSAVVRELDHELKRRGLAMRAARLKRAAQRIDREGLGSVKTIWMDGFIALSDPELALVQAIAKHANVTVTLQDVGPSPSPWTPPRDTRELLLRTGFREETCNFDRSPSITHLFAAPTIDREADEIARRILDAAANGREFREIGIVVRNPDAYVPVLRAALKRFGIPARFYFTTPLADHGVTRFLGGVVNSLLTGWEHDSAIAVMKLAGSDITGNCEIDWFDFKVREQLPGKGLAGLRSLAATQDRLLDLLQAFASLDAWLSISAPPSEWAVRLRSLRGLYRPPRPAADADHYWTGIWRAQAAALDAFDAAMQEAAQCLNSTQRISLAEFWKTAKAVLRLTFLRDVDHRRNVVHVMSLHEARQWELPVVFVCGLVENEFPRHHPQDLFFPEAARRRLREHGLRVPTTADLDAEEQFLFKLAGARAGVSLTLSYPEADSRGARNVPSSLLDSLGSAQRPQPVRPQPGHRTASRHSTAIYSNDLLQLMNQKHATMNPTALESFLQCPFQFFGRHTLRLKSRPLRPEERLDFKLQGQIVHQVLLEWYRNDTFLEILFDRIFHDSCTTHMVPAGYRTEALRRQMLDDIQRFVDKGIFSGLASVEIIPERDFNMTLGDTVAVKGRIDRVDRLPDGRVLITDYKYSGAQGIRDRLTKEQLLQGPLYMLAMQRIENRQPAGMIYCGLKRHVQCGGWTDTISGLNLRTEALTPELLTRAEQITLEIAEQIRAGRVAPAPADLKPCGYCDFRDVCRYRTTATVLTAQAE